MKSIRKIITAAAAAAVITTVGATTAFALSDALPPVDSVNNQISGNYMNLDYGTGYSKVINKTSETRYCSAYVETQVKYANTPVGGIGSSATETGNVSPGKSLTATVAPEYISSTYQYYCLGGIRTGATPQAPTVETLSDTYRPG